MYFMALFLHKCSRSGGTDVGEAGLSSHDNLYDLSVSKKACGRKVNFFAAHFIPQGYYLYP